MKALNAMLLCDFYKVLHREQYKSGTEIVYSNWTPRSGRYAPHIKEVVAVGYQAFAKEYLIEFFNENFFGKPKKDVMARYARTLKNCLFIQEPDTSHVEALHDLGYLPLEIKSLDEGTLVPFRVPMLTIENTDPRFFWLTNYFETLMSNTLWKVSTTASTARVYRQLLDKFALETTGSTAGVEFQGHDFSMRGLSCLEDAARSGVGHLLSFVGTDTIPAIEYAEQYYNANMEEELIGCSVVATEHSVSSSNILAIEKECGDRTLAEEIYIKGLITETYPTGIVSLVSDTFDLWKVLTDVLPALKDDIMTRDGGPESIDKVVIRPDSGDPADILCGTLNKLEVFTKEDCVDEEAFPSFAEDYMECKLDSETPHGECGGDLTCDVVYDGKIYNLTFSPEWNRHDKQYYYMDNYGEDTTPTINSTRTFSAADKGVVELLWDTFGGTVNEQGYKVLDPHIGAIYGDAITIERCTDICERLKAKGFASTNVVFGVGSYTYQYTTRDTLGFAMKSTSVDINGERIAIFKDPITDDGTKKSAVGRVSVHKRSNGDIFYRDENDHGVAVNKNLLTTLFKDGKLVKETSLKEIREKLK